MQLKEIIKKRIRNNRGFTLIEAIAVLITIGIIAAVVVSRVSSTSTYSVKSVAAALKSHIRYAQTMAMSTNSIWGINISDSKHYSLFRGTTATTVVLPGADSNPVALEANAPSLNPSTVSFDGNGSPVAGYTTPFTTVTMGGETEPIKLHRIRGSYHEKTNKKEFKRFHSN